jgi:hypothetical protein
VLPIRGETPGARHHPLLSTDLIAFKTTALLLHGLKDCQEFAPAKGSPQDADS